MKKIHYIITLFVLAITLGCTDDNNSVDLDSVGAPTNISALTTVTQDNTGKVTFLPKGEGVTHYEIYFGDGTAEPAFVNPGETVTHIYKEGVYQSKIVGTTLNGKSTEVMQEVTVSFLKPTDLVFTVTPDLSNNYAISIQATAKLETSFNVYFGDVANEIPTAFMEGETIKHVYASLGVYTVKVVALSGGSATASESKEVTISSPIVFPVTFESATPVFGDFGGAVSTVITNPHVSTGNPSAKVAKLNKSMGSEVWAGSLITLDQPIDFTSNKIIKMKVWCPKSGIIVKMKLENLTDGTIFKEVDVTNTVVNGWEELSFDFNSINVSNKYQKIVVFFDFGNQGTNANYYYDDIKLVAGSETLSLPLTFQSTTLTYTFSGFGGANTLVIDNPNSSGIDISTKVAALTKNSGSEVWAGSSILLADPIDFSTQKKIKMKVWSPKAGIIVKMKLERKGATNPDATNIEVDATSTVANGWEELTFDFSAINNANNYQNIVVFFDFGNSGTGAAYYFDDIKQSN